MNILTKRITSLSTISLFTIGSIIGGTVSFIATTQINHDAEIGSSQYNKEVTAEKNKGIKKLLAEGRYKCCITNPCSYCFSDPDHQNENLVCGCLESIMNGEHPCGECIGEILEGNGNPLISEYFATAIAEELGEEYLSTLKQIIADKYDMPVDRQL